MPAFGLSQLGSTRKEYLVECVERERRPVQSVLDIGCGYGWGLAELTGKAAELVGVDMSLEQLEQARKNYPHIQFVHQSAKSLPFLDERFDAVILSEVIEHVGDENKQLVIDEAFRVLKPGGLFIFTCPYAGIFAWADPMDFKRRFTPIYRAYMRAAKYNPSTPIEVGHKHLSFREIKSLFGDRFALESVQYCGMVSPAISWALVLGERLKMLPQGFLNYLGGLRGWESGVPYPRIVAFNIRIRARKKEMTRSAELQQA